MSNGWKAAKMFSAWRVRAVVADKGQVLSRLVELQGARLEMGLYAKGEEKAQIALQVSKLRKETDVERERAAWKAAFLKLKDPRD